MTKEAIPRCIEKLKQVSAELSKKLGYLERETSNGEKR
jgi:hypothetical protein